MEKPTNDTAPEDLPATLLEVKSRCARTDARAAALIDARLGLTGPSRHQRQAARAFNISGERVRQIMTPYRLALRDHPALGQCLTDFENQLPLRAGGRFQHGRSEVGVDWFLAVARALDRWPTFQRAQYNGALWYVPPGFSNFGMTMRQSETLTARCMAIPQTALIEHIGRTGGPKAGWLLERVLPAGRLICVDGWIVHYAGNGTNAAPPPWIHAVRRMLAVRSDLPLSLAWAGIQRNVFRSRAGLPTCDRMPPAGVFDSACHARADICVEQEHLVCPIASAAWLTSIEQIWAEELSAKGHASRQHLVDVAASAGYGESYARTMLCYSPILRTHGNRAIFITHLQVS